MGNCCSKPTPAGRELSFAVADFDGIPASQAQEPRANDALPITPRPSNKYHSPATLLRGNTSARPSSTGRASSTGTGQSEARPYSFESGFGTSPQQQASAQAGGGVKIYGNALFTGENARLDNFRSPELRGSLQPALSNPDLVELNLDDEPSSFRRPSRAPAHQTSASLSSIGGTDHRQSTETPQDAKHSPRAVPTLSSPNVTEFAEVVAAGQFGEQAGCKPPQHAPCPFCSASGIPGVSQMATHITQHHHALLSQLEQGCACLAADPFDVGQSADEVYCPFSFLQTAVCSHAPFPSVQPASLHVRGHHADALVGAALVARGLLRRRTTCPFSKTCRCSTPLETVADMAAHLIQQHPGSMLVMYDAASRASQSACGDADADPRCPTCGLGGLQGEQQLRHHILQEHADQLVDDVLVENGEEPSTSSYKLPRPLQHGAVAVRLASFHLDSMEYQHADTSSAKLHNVVATISSSGADLVALQSLASRDAATMLWSHLNQTEPWGLRLSDAHGRAGAPQDAAAFLWRKQSSVRPWADNSPSSFHMPSTCEGLFRRCPFYGLFDVNGVPLLAVSVQLSPTDQGGSEEVGRLDRLVEAAVEAHEGGPLSSDMEVVVMGSLSVPASARDWAPVTGSDAFSLLVPYKEQRALQAFPAAQRHHDNLLLMQRAGRVSSLSRGGLCPPPSPVLEGLRKWQERGKGPQPPELGSSYSSHLLVWADLEVQEHSSAALQGALFKPPRLGQGAGVDSFGASDVELKHLASSFLVDPDDSGAGKVAELNEQCKRYAGQVQELQAQVQQLKRQPQAQPAQAASNGATVQAQAEEIAQLKKKVAAYEEQIRLLEQKEQDVHEFDSSDSEDMLPGLDGGSKEKSLKQVDKKDGEVDAKITALQQQVRQLEADLQKARGEAVSQPQADTRLQEELANSRQQLEAAQQLAEKLNADHAKQIEEMQARISGLEEMRAAASKEGGSQAQELVRQVTELEAGVKEANVRASTHEQRAQELQKQLEQAQQRLHFSTVLSQDLATSLGGAHSKLQELSSMRQAVVEELADMRSALFGGEVLEQMTAALRERELKLLSQASTESSKQLEAARQDLAAAEARLARANAEHAESLRRQAEEAERNLKQQTAEATQQVAEYRDRWRAEFDKRRKLHNQMVEIKGNIRVLCRVRPLLGKELDSGEGGQVDVLNSEMVRVATGTTSKEFELDRVFAPEEGQHQVFEEVEALVVSVLDGFNVCIMAYGQTGSGKTFTMQGPPDDPGVNTRAMSQLFKVAEERSSSFHCSFHTSVLEIYNEQIFDLLVPGSKDQGDKLDVKEGPDGMFVAGLKLAEVATIEDVHSLLKTASSNRSTFSTNMNEHSSRSHLVLSLHVTASSKTTGQGLRGKLHLIDLAGSERLKSTGAEGDRLKEAQAINKSLSALGDVIQALQQRQQHIPYRNSKLTRLLEDSLGGNSKCVMVVNCSPAAENAAETKNALEFASRARKVELGKAKANTTASPASPANGPRATASPIAKPTTPNGTAASPIAKPATPNGTAASPIAKPTTPNGTAAAPIARPAATNTSSPVAAAPAPKPAQNGAVAAPARLAPVTAPSTAATPPSRLAPVTGPGAAAATAARPPVSSPLGKPALVSSPFGRPMVPAVANKQ